MGCGPSTQSAAQLANDISGEPPINGDVNIVPVKYREFLFCYLFLDFVLLKIIFTFKLKKLPAKLLMFH